MRKALLVVLVVIPLFFAASKETNAQCAEGVIQKNCYVNTANACAQVLSGGDEEIGCPSGTVPDTPGCAPGEDCCSNFLQGNDDNPILWCDPEYYCCIEEEEEEEPVNCQEEYGEEYECIDSGTGGCADRGGEYVSCDQGDGNTGTCCAPPVEEEPPISVCSNNGGTCRIEEPDADNEGCEWDEIPSSAFNCNEDTQICCREAENIVECSDYSDATCRGECGELEIPLSSPNNCWGIGEDGEECCLSVDYDPIEVPIFCDESGNPTTNQTSQELYTAIGCISIETGNTLIAFFLRWSIGIAGGVALLMIVYAGILILTSGGDPRKLQAGKELLTAAVSGFVFLLLSVYLLEFIGVDILNIAGF